MIRRGGPQPPLLDERTDAGGYGPLEPAKAPRGHPTGDEKLGMRVVRHRADGSEPLGHAIDNPARRSRKPRSPAEEQQVERAVDVEPEAPPPPQIMDLVAGHLAQPARERVIGRQVARGRNVTRHRDRDDVGREPVVGEGQEPVGGGGLDEGPPVGEGREGDRARPEDHDAIGSAGRQERGQP